MTRILLAAVTAAAALVIAVGAASATSDSYGAASFHPFTADPRNTSCVPWVEPSGFATRNCDPINLVFPGKTWTQVRDRLRAKGWTTYGSGSTQYVHFADTATWVAQHAQLFRSDGFGKRYHVRLWQAPGPVTIGGVHHESGLFTHVIDRSWDASEAFVRGQLCTFGVACASTFLAQQSSIQGGDGEWRGWANDAAAAVVP